MPGLIHDRPLRGSRHGRGRRMARPERMAGVLARVQPGPLHELLHHARHVDSRQGRPAAIARDVRRSGTKARHRCLPARSTPEACEPDRFPGSIRTESRSCGRRSPGRSSSAVASPSGHPFRTRNPRHPARPAPNVGTRPANPGGSRLGPERPSPGYRPSARAPSEPAPSRGSAESLRTIRTPSHKSREGPDDVRLI